MNKRFILTEEDKNEIVSLYSQKNIVIEQASAEKSITLKDIQNKLIELGYGDMLGKSGADGIFGKMTYSAITQAVGDIEKRKQMRDSTANLAPMKSKEISQLPTPESPKPELKMGQSLLQINKDITTPEQAQSAIEAAKAEANKRAEEERQAARLGRQIARRTQEMCRTVGRAVNPVIPFKKGVATQELCDALRGCISDGLIVRDESVFEACNAFPAKQTTPTTGSTQTTNTTTV
jgi:hypothetical protein